ncbi:MAG: hypothetical protein EOM19_05565 [Candidatus Moranbacteria bacterium]|nr:hypothetical protein [Candidatus Moranbacteria bacterium]
MKWIISFFQANAFLQNSALLFAGTMTANILNYVFHFAMGRMVSPQAYGEVEAIVSLLAIITIPSSAIVIVATRYAARFKARNDVRKSERLFFLFHKKVFLFIFPLLFIGFFATPWVQSFLKIEDSFAIYFLWGLAFLSFFNAIAKGTMSGWQRFLGLGIVNASVSFVKLVFSVFFVWLGFSVGGVVGALLLSSVSGYILFLFILGRFRKKEYNKGKEKPTLEGNQPKNSVYTYAIPVLFSTFAFMMLGNADMVLAKHHLSPEDAGLYGALFIVSKTIFFFSSILAGVMFSMSAEEHEKSILHKTKNRSKIFRNAALLTLFICLISIVFFFLFPAFVLSIFFGEKYLAGTHLLGWFAVASSLYTLIYLFLQYFLSIHKTIIVWWVVLGVVAEAFAIYIWGYSIESIISLILLFHAIILSILVVYKMIEGSHFPLKCAIFQQNPIK